MNKFSANTDLVPGASYTTTVTMTNTGSVDATGVQLAVQAVTVTPAHTSPSLADTLQIQFGPEGRLARCTGTSAGQARLTLLITRWQPVLIRTSPSPSLCPRL